MTMRISSTQSAQSTSKQVVNDPCVRLHGTRKTSCTSLIWISVLLATSTVSGLTVKSPIQARFVSPDARLSGETFKSTGHFLVRTPQTMKLLYSHGDYSQPEDQRRQNEHVTAVSGMRNRMSKWWTTVFPVAEFNSQDPQAVVDDYLEFLDRRYHRLHDEDVAPAPVPTTHFSAMDWLLDKESIPNEGACGSAQSQEDALFVLGVAELASDRLLQKHQIPPPNEPAIDTKASLVSPSASRSNGLFGCTEKPATSIVHRVRDRRRALIAYEEKIIKRLALTFARAAALAPLGIVKTAEVMWRHGGGKKTFAMTLGLLTGVFLLLRPAMAAILDAVFE